MNISTKISAALAVAAVSAAVMGYSSSANASSLRDSCKAKTHTAVESCCHTWIRSHGTPMWMQGGNCSSASVSACRGGGVVARASVAPLLCYDQTLTIADKGGSDHTPPGRGGARGQ